LPRFAANLSMLYPEFNFLERFEVAARDGFKAVEYLFPYDHPRETIAQRLAANGLRQVLFNGPPGDWNHGERGIACLPGREAEFRAGIYKALDYATALACPRIHVMAGVLPAQLALETAHAIYLKNLAWAADEAARVGIDILIEPINTRDIPGYLLNRQIEAHAIVQDIGSPHLKVQMDLYHCQIVEGDVAVKLRDYLPSGRVGHGVSSFSVQ
jgi:hydroxypyruvate isomerase